MPMDSCGQWVSKKTSVKVAVLCALNSEAHPHFDTYSMAYPKKGMLATLQINGVGGQLFDGTSRIFGTKTWSVSFFVGHSILAVGCIYAVDQSN